METGNGHNQNRCESDRSPDGRESVTMEESTIDYLLPAVGSGGGEEEDEGQDDIWGETTTAVTSERSASLEELVPRGGPMESNGRDARIMLRVYMFCILLAFTVLTPPLFIMLPQVLWGSRLEPCGAICEGLYISVAFKLLILILGSWAVFFRSPRYVLPRLVEFRALLILLLSLLLLSYWLFYAVRILGQRERNLLSVVQYTVSLVDTLIFIHYLAMVLLEIRQLQPSYFLTVVRSSDGETRCYTIGRVRLVVSVHRSFSQVQRLDNTMKSGSEIDPREAAQTIFPHIAQSLQRYLRCTRQTHLYSMEAIVQHLTLCLTHNMSPQAFLEQYLSPGPQCQYSGAKPAEWTIVSEESVTRSLKSQLTFCLRSATVRLVVSVSEIPSLTLNENFIPANSHRFLVQLYPPALDTTTISPA
ncbi:vang-like protein 1 isoform X4 [Dendrobates tinctorius]|uniref:vang-like protein 1 isoform X4 n=1 Tax=Dendrobates tinctorius TaxID=92724 RepID=UPI003CC9D51F